MAVGAEPNFVRDMLQYVNKHDLITGHSLCGAGGGGFAVVVLRKEANKETLENIIHEFNNLQNHDSSLAPMTVHTLLVDEIGIQVSVHNN